MINDQFPISVTLCFLLLSAYCLLITDYCSLLTVYPVRNNAPLLCSGVTF